MEELFIHVMRGRGWEAESSRIKRGLFLLSSFSFSVRLLIKSARRGYSGKISDEFRSRDSFNIRSKILDDHKSSYVEKFEF